MKICKITKQQNFKAIKIAETKNIYKGVATQIDLYKISRSDKSFLDKLMTTVDFSKRLSCLNEYDCKRWEKVFKYAIESAKDKNNESYLAVSNSAPCGMISFFSQLKNIYLDAICDIPLKNGRRTNYTGSTLFYQLFKIADDIQASSINLLAVVDGPFDNVSKYEQKGFKNLGIEDGYVKMSCNKYKIKEQLKKLSFNVQYNQINNSENVSLDGLII